MQKCIFVSFHFAKAIFNIIDGESKRKSGKCARVAQWSMCTFDKPSINACQWIFINVDGQVHWLILIDKGSDRTQVSN